MKLLAALAVMLTGACMAGAGQAPPSTARVESQTATSAPWTVTFHLSGGFAGVMRTLRVSSTGDLLAEDARRGASFTARATSDELAQLASFVAKDQSGSQVRSTPCPDCLLYELEIDVVGGRRSEFHLDDATLQASGIEPVVRTLVEMLNRTISATAAGPTGLLSEKSSRSAVDNKIDSQLLIEIDKRERPAPTESTLRTSVRIDAEGRALVDIRADVTAPLLRAVQSSGGTIVTSAPQYRSLVAWMPLLKLKSVAADPAVQAITPAAEATTNNRP